jgi:YHS domain-containing protein
MRGIILLLLTVVALAILRMLVSDVTRAASKAFKGREADKQTSGEKDAEQPRSAGRLVRDPHTGAYIDEATALKHRIGEKTFFFESAESRDAFLRERSA